LAVLLTGYLIGPRVTNNEQQSTCVGNVELAGPFGISLNCDSPQFMWLAREPAGLLTPQNPRQARPGLIFAAALLAAPLSVLVPAGGAPKPVDTGIQNPTEITESFTRDLPAYLAYVLLNIAILGASFFLLRKLIGRLSGASLGTPETIIAVSAGLLLVANDVTKAFVWSPHTQAFNILVPVMAVYATVWTRSGALMDRRFAVGLGIAVGLGMMAYPVFIVVPICVLPPALMLIAREHVRPVRLRAMVNLALLLALSILPSVLWYLFVRFTTGDFFHFEMAQGEVVWMADAWTKGADVFARTWLFNAWQLLAAAAPQAVPVLILAVLTAAAAFRGSRTVALSSVSPAIAVGLYVSVAMLGFYASVGWIVDRLAYPMVPPLLVAAATVAVVVSLRLDGRGRRGLAIGAMVLAMAQIAYAVAKDGPWS
jgi:hypothetical protein